MFSDLNPYQAYTDGSIFSDSPLNLVVALYEGALDATRQAEKAMRAGDIPLRTKTINKAVSILTELLVTLNHEKGGEISKNLQRLYTYMQQQLLKAHIRQVPEPLVEVGSLLSTMLEGWREAVSAQTSERMSAAMQYAGEPQFSATAAASYVCAPVYGGYMDDSVARANTAYSF